MALLLLWWPGIAGISTEYYAHVVFLVLVLWPPGRPSIASVERVYHKKGKGEMDEKDDKGSKWAPP